MEFRVRQTESYIKLTDELREIKQTQKKQGKLQGVIERIEALEKGKDSHKPTENDEVVLLALKGKIAELEKTISS